MAYIKKSLLKRWWIIPALVTIGGIFSVIEGLYRAESPRYGGPITTILELQDNVGELVRIDGQLIDTGIDGHFYEDNIHDSSFMRLISRLDIYRTPDRWVLNMIELEDVLVPARFVRRPASNHIPKYIVGEVWKLSDDEITQQLISKYTVNNPDFFPYSIRVRAYTSSDAIDFGIGLILIGIVSVPVILLWRKFKKRKQG